MAKAAQKIQAIMTQPEADELLRDIGRLEDKIAQIHARESESVRQANERAVAEGKPLIDARKAMVDKLEAWARENEKDWPSRTLELSFGKIFFRASSGAVRLARSVEYVLDHLKARRLFHCIRKTEEPDKEAIKALDDATLREIGCKRERPDYFHYEIFRPGVK